MNNPVNKGALIGTALLLAIGLAACSAGNNTPESTQSEAPAQSAGDAADQQSEEPTEPAEAEGDAFQDPTYNFQIVLPGEPAIQPVADEIDGVVISGNIYVNEISNEEAYVVGVSHYELTDPDSSWDDRLSLEGAVEGMVTNVDGTIVSTENESTMLGYPASLTVFTIPNGGGSPMEGRSQMVIRDRTLYNIMGIGVSEEDFVAAVDSFSFLD